MGKIPEKRKYVRISLPYITRFRVKPCDGEASDNWTRADTVDLSFGGVCFYSRANLEVGTILDLEIGFSHLFSPVICVGRVIRVKSHLDTSKTSYAIEFNEISELMKVMISKSLELADWQ